MSGCTCDAAIVRAPRWGLTSCPCNAARRACPSLSLMLHLTHLHIEPAEACRWAWNHGRCVLISSMLPVTQMRARFWHAFGAHWIGTGQTQFRLTDAATCTERLLNDACQRSTFAVSWDLHHGSALHKFLLMICDHSGACLPAGPPLERAIHQLLQSLDQKSLQKLVQQLESGALASSLSQISDEPAAAAAAACTAPEAAPAAAPQAAANQPAQAPPATFRLSADQQAIVCIHHGHLSASLGSVDQ